MNEFTIYVEFKSDTDPALDREGSFTVRAADAEDAEHAALTQATETWKPQSSFGISAGTFRASTLEEAFDLRAMLVPDRSERFVREGRALVTDPTVRPPAPPREKSWEAFREVMRQRDEDIARSVRRHVGTPR